MTAELHIYAQGAWHDPAHLVGTREGLLALRRALDDALETGSATTDTVFVVDGEGYKVHVRQVTSNALESYLLPYSDAVAQDVDYDHATPQWPKKGGA